MESSWLETHWARPFYLTLVFCLALGLLQAIKLYLQRQRLLRDLRLFPSPPTHWLYGHSKVDTSEGGVKEDAGNPIAQRSGCFLLFLPSLSPAPTSPASLWLPHLHYSMKHPRATAAAAATKSLQSCTTLCDPIDGSPSGSTFPGILQARTLERVAISFSNACH